MILGGAYSISEVKGGVAEAAASVQSQGKTLIGVSKAEAIALKSAPGRVESIDLEQKLSGSYYDVEIQQTNQESEVRVDAYTGEVLSVRTETDNDDDDNYTAGTEAAGRTLISAAKASEIASASVKGTVAEIDLDLDNGSAIYEVEIRNGRSITEVGVDAYSSKIVYRDEESEDDED
ncbi:Peptidase propeptide and YPEB domain protein [compost metagenome]